MNRITLSLSALSLVAAFAQPAHAADVTRDDILNLFKTEQVDKNHDAMVSKKEFMDMMSKAWDMEATKMKATAKGMTLEQYKEFTSMFNLNVGS